MQQNKYHTHQCKDLTLSLIGEKIIVSGWVENIRDHGGVLFLDLRDNTEVLQIVSNDDNLFKGLRKESVIKVSGVLRKRDKETINPRLRTGEIELLTSDLEILGSSTHDLPFEIISSKNTKEEVRLRYRYLDLRNKQVKQNILLRSELLHFLS